jgi:PadR family transcriptional regulator, regulatory protein PadR
MAKRAENNLQGSLELLILKTLEHGPNHGFGITTHVQAASEGLLQIEEGSLYPALHRLEKSKLIAGAWKTTENGRRARFYSLTTPGTKRLEEARVNWKTVARGVKKVLRFT